MFGLYRPSGRVRCPDDTVSGPGRRRLKGTPFAPKGDPVVKKGLQIVRSLSVPSSSSFFFLLSFFFLIDRSIFHR